MIFSFGRIKIKLSFSFVALLALMIILCDERIVLCSLASSLIHESGHLFFMYASGETPKSVFFTLFGMRIDRSDSVIISFKKEVIIAFGGIIFNVIFAVIFFILYSLFRVSDFFVLSVVNLTVAAVNSFPVSVLDCGRALRYAFLIRKNNDESEKCTSAVSTVFIVIFTAASLAYTVIFGFNISLICINLYLIFITIIKKWS